MFLLFDYRKAYHQHNPSVYCCQYKGSTTTLDLHDEDILVIIPRYQTRSASMSAITPGGGELITIEWSMGKLFLVPGAKADLLASGLGQFVFLLLSWSQVTSIQQR